MTVDPRELLPEAEEVRESFVDVYVKLTDRFDLPEAEDTKRKLLLEAAPAEPVDVEPLPATGLSAAPDPRHDEVKQHLFDLEYLEETAVERKSVRPTAAFKLALRVFRREASALLAREDIASLENQPVTIGNSSRGGRVVASSSVLALLARAVSTDGETVIEHLPASGETGLTSRILQFQLKRLGLFDGSAGAPFGEMARAGFEQLRRRLSPGYDWRMSDVGGLVGDAKVFLALADYRQLMSLLGSALDTSPVLLKAWDLDDLEGAPLALLNVSGDDFIEPTSAVRSYVVSREFDVLFADVDEDRAEVRSFGDSDSNRLAVNFLQYALWSAGYYEGRIDGVAGRMTEEALELAVKTLRLDRDRVLRPALGCYWAVNLSALVTTVFSNTQSFEDQMTFLAGEVQDVDTSEEAREPRRGFLASIREAFRRAFEFGRRVITSVSAMLKSVVDAVRNGVKLVWGALETMTSAVRNFFTMLYRGAREGLMMIDRGLRGYFQFVLRRPILTLTEENRPAAVSRFDFDRDTSTIFNPNVNDVYLVRHAEMCRRLARIHSSAMYFIGRVINFVVRGASGPIGWISLFISVLREITPVFRMSRQAA